MTTVQSKDKGGLKDYSIVLFLVVMLVSGCTAFRPDVVATQDTLYYKPPLSTGNNSRSPEAMAARPAQLIRIDKGSRILIGTWQQNGGQFQVPLKLLDPRACYAITNARGNFIPVRYSTSDAYSFYLPQHSEVGYRTNELYALERQRSDLDSQSRRELSKYEQANRWLQTSGHYQNGQCVRPPPKPSPKRPETACAANESRDWGETACWGSFALGYSCEKAYSMMKGANSSLSGLAASIQCSSLAAKAQGMQLTPSQWFSDLLIDGPSKTCMEAANRGQINIFNAPVCAVFVSLFNAKMEQCIADAGNRCQSEYSRWQEQVQEARDFPAKTVTTCQENIRIVAAGTTRADDLRREADALKPELALARARLDEAKRKFSVTEVADFPCGK